MRKSTAAAVSVAWGVALGGTFGCLLPYLLNEWHFHRPWPPGVHRGGLVHRRGRGPLL
jgi:hypothetical protein